MRLLLDTNAYSALMRGRNDVVAVVRRAELLYLSAIVVGELLFGFRNGARYERNRDTFRAFLANPYVEFLDVTHTTADRFARIASGLRRKGTPIPTNDMWIAAHALEVGADLMSFDRHFEVVEGLVLAEL